MDKKEKSLIIAERIKLKYAGEVAGFVVIIAVIVGFIVLSAYLESSIGIWICCLCLIGIIIWLIIDMIKIYQNNQLPNVLITFKNEIFTVHDLEGKIDFTKDDIVDMSYKNKKSFIYTPYYASTMEWNYGTFNIFLNHNRKITLKNVANPDKVFDKLCHLLEWDLIEE